VLPLWVGYIGLDVILLLRQRHGLYDLFRAALQPL
jgi:hypothetical protein